MLHSESTLLRSKHLNEVPIVNYYIEVIFWGITYLVHAKCQIKIIFECTTVICKPTGISEIFVILFKTFGMQKDDMIFFLEVFKVEVLCKKAVSNGWCKDSSRLISVRIL